MKFYRHGNFITLADGRKGSIIGEKFRFSNKDGGHYVFPSLLNFSDVDSPRFRVISPEYPGIWPIKVFLTGDLNTRLLEKANNLSAMKQGATLFSTFSLDLDTEGRLVYQYEFFRDQDVLEIIESAIEAGAQFLGTLGD